MRLWLTLLLGLAGLAYGQADTATLLAEARSLAAEARETYEIHTPDQPLWREALALVDRARRLDPDDLEGQRLQALLYSQVRWYSRAFSNWNEYLQAGGTLESRPDDVVTPAESYAEAGNQLGYARYVAGNAAAALGYYEAVLREVPDDREALHWVGLINLELDEVDAARSYFERLARVDPGSETARRYLELIAERETVGEEASLAYRQGLAAYEQGALVDAFESFVRATEINPDFTNANIWAGRTALELEQPATAIRHWERVVAARPDDAGARHFLQMAQAQQRWGVVAGREYYAGQAFYQSGELDQAADAFGNAVEANPDFVEAWAWAGRVRQELGQPDLAQYYWQGVLDRRPGDEQAIFQLEVSRQQVRFGAEAGRAFAEAVRHYQMAEFEEAEEAFRRAVDLNPDYATAWGWLGRIHFTNGDWAQAAEAYERAYELEPDNDDYRFFAQEAELLREAN